MVVIGRECSEFIASRDGKGIECVQNHMTPFTFLVRHEQNQSITPPALEKNNNSGTLDCNDGISYSV